MLWNNPLDFLVDSTRHINLKFSQSFFVFNVATIRKSFGKLGLVFGAKSHAMQLANCEKYTFFYFSWFILVNVFKKLL